MTWIMALIIIFFIFTFFLLILFYFINILLFSHTFSLEKWLFSLSLSFIFFFFLATLLYIAETLWFLKIYFGFILWMLQKRREKKKLGLRLFPYFFWFITQWVLGNVTLYVHVFLGWGVCCESLFLTFILGVATKHWFCITCDWSPIGLIHFKLPN